MIAIEAAEKAYNNLSSAQSKYINNDEIMVVIDMTLPSSKKRLYVYEFNTKRILREHHCSHGVNSADPKDKARAISFSNANASRKTCKGSQYTREVWHGKHGKSLRIGGLEKGINDNAYLRYIEIHPADYVTDAYIRNHGRAGCSFGCYAVDPAISSSLIDLVRDGVFLYVHT